MPFLLSFAVKSKRPALRRESTKGFTLIELLIVITIIAILAAIGLTTYITFLKNSRDAKRQSDLKFIQSALEQYHADQKYYPGSLDFSVGIQLTNATGVSSPLPQITKTYLNNIPIGPTGASEYQYKAYKWKTDRTGYEDCTETDNAPTSSSQCVKYCLYAKTENLIQKTDLCPDQNDTNGNPYNLEVTSP